MSTSSPDRKRRRPATIDLTGSSDDEVQCLDDVSSETKPEKIDAQKESQSTSQPPRQGILGLDRKKMEEERLARLKRKQQTEESEQPPAKKLYQFSIGSNIAHRMEATVLPSGARQAASVPGLSYPDGIVKRTWVRGQPRQDDITISEVFQQHYGLELAVMSSFQWDMDWLFSKFDLNKSRYLLVVGEKDEEAVRLYANSA